MTSGTDLNSILEQGVYYCYSDIGHTLLNKPSDVSSIVIIVVHRPATTYAIQELYCINNIKYWRHITAVTTTPIYGNWQNITLNFPSFYKNYSNLEGLASALGTLGANKGQLIQQKVGNLTNIDANDCKPTGFYYLYQGCQNTPSEYFIMFSINYGALDIIQIGVGLLTSKLYIRTYTGNGWSAWNEK